MSSVTAAAGRLDADAVAGLKLAGSLGVERARASPSDD
jgi:hypothetical protein